MLTTRHIFSAILAATLTFGGVVSANAQNFSSNVVLMAQNAVSPAQAKSIARAKVKGGEVVDISRRGDTYRVRVIAKNGKVVDVYIDANTGRVKR